MSKSLVDRGKQMISSKIFPKAVNQESTWGITQDGIIFRCYTNIKHHVRRRFINKVIKMIMFSSHTFLIQVPQGSEACFFLSDLLQMHIEPKRLRLDYISYYFLVFFRFSGSSHRPIMPHNVHRLSTVLRTF